MEVLDKGKAAAVTLYSETKEKNSGKIIFENVMTSFVRGAGGFGGRKAAKGSSYTICLKTKWLILVSDRGPLTATNLPPKRLPDMIVEEKTTENQALVYRFRNCRDIYEQTC